MTNQRAGVSSARPAHTDGWGFRQESKDLLVAITGGAIVGMPLLYTMEMWEHGMLLSAFEQLSLIAAILVLNLLFSLVSGFRHEYGFANAVLESFTAVGIGMVFSAAILWLVGEVEFGAALGEITGKVLLETAAVSLGVSVADSYVRGKSRADDDERSAESKREKRRSSRRDLERLQVRQDVRDLSATLTGAVLFSLSIGPTEEVVLIAGRLTPAQLGLVVLSSAALIYVILFASGVREQPVYVPSLVQKPAAETVLAYAAAVLVSAGMLALLGAPEALAGFRNFLAATVVLALPAAVGGAAGRLAL